MSEPDNILDVDFDAQMRGLFQQAERAIGKRAEAVIEAAASGNSPDSADLKVVDEKAGAALMQPAHTPGDALPHALRPLIQEIESLVRTTGENTRRLTTIELATSAEGGARQELPKIVADLRALLEMKNGVSHSMFSALHEELKGYKDSFLLQTVYRPIIRDLLSLFDDLTEIRRQIREAICDADETDATRALIERVRTTEMNIDHNVEFVLEVLARLDVTQIPPGTGKLDKFRQRVIGVETTDQPDADTQVVRSVKCGFLWHERVLRPEEVVVKKYRPEACQVAAPEPTSSAVP
jgi:molecular chaperone GrpE (heat shock protein)